LYSCRRTEMASKSATCGAQICKRHKAFRLSDARRPPDMLRVAPVGRQRDIC
jgi:hypothetical protein